MSEGYRIVSKSNGEEATTGDVGRKQEYILLWKYSLKRIVSRAK